ncbi:MAG: hypothetical protein DHS20C13_13840 [Thermodesulfobacteriota bacterium]|nr:MAG: hypothetical protein DHS20C13_13840 [Thermodesulfobacteriota bacterium]
MKGSKYQVLNNNYRIKRIGFLFFLLSVFAFSILITGCAKTYTRTALPQNLEDQVRVAGFEDVKGLRAWGDKPNKEFNETAILSVKKESQSSTQIGDEVYFLAISGGGADGAYGVGLLNGWSEAGTRPEFKLVTGISTGALIATFAFLGSDYDQQLKESYTGSSDEDIYTKKSILTAYWRDSLFGVEPLKNLIAQNITQEVLQAVAREYEKGRFLLVGTTQLDAQRLVIWNMGAIAASGKPGALDLFRSVLLASASMPSIFPPVFIPVSVNGQTYEEMHVDGGTFTEVMLYNEALSPMLKNVDDVKKIVGDNETFEKFLKRKRVLYVIKNDQKEPEWSDVQDRIAPIAGRAIGTLIKSHYDGDIYRIYVLSERDEISFNLASIPEGTNIKTTNGMFDTVYMQKLYNLAFEKAKNGYPWSNYPPGFQPVEEGQE